MSAVIYVVRGAFRTLVPGRDAAELSVGHIAEAAAEAIAIWLMSGFSAVNNKGIRFMTCELRINIYLRM